ncbi:hypothetical protein [Bradyrhizobium valentinum]|uniref:hypothetical protein n=1 Tax=Bradyrhizobium valentinum TaxID=1518501 RepID=UPI0012E3F4A7|nr:hypothetical protein [Bradyrhizobium valentinum]
MTKAKRNYSLILKRDVNVLWDNIGGADPTIFNFCGTVAEANCSRSRLAILNCANWIRTLSGGSGVQALTTRNFARQDCRQVKARGPRRPLVIIPKQTCKFASRGHLRHLTACIVVFSHVQLRTLCPQLDTNAKVFSASERSAWICSFSSRACSTFWVAR